MKPKAFQHLYTLETKLPVMSCPLSSQTFQCLSQILLKRLTWGSVCCLSFELYWMHCVKFHQYIIADLGHVPENIANARMEEKRESPGTIFNFLLALSCSIGIIIHTSSFFRFLGPSLKSLKSLLSNKHILVLWDDIKAPTVHYSVSYIQGCIHHGIFKHPNLMQ